MLLGLAATSMSLAVPLVAKSVIDGITGSASVTPLVLLLVGLLLVGLLLLGTVLGLDVSDDRRVARSRARPARARRRCSR